MGPPADATWVRVTCPADSPESLTGHILSKIKETEVGRLLSFGVLHYTALENQTLHLLLSLRLAKRLLVFATLVPFLPTR